MADSILRLKVESQEYDQKIKRAAEGIQLYARKCREVGGTLEKLDDGVEEFVKSLGKMDTVSRSAKGSLSEMTKAFTELTVQYNKLTDEEKASPFGKALSQSLGQLKGRINEAKKELADVDKELGQTGKDSNGLGGVLDQLAGKFGLSTKVLGAWGIALGAGTAALNVAKDAFFASEENIDEWGRTVEAGQDCYEAFLQSLNSGDISGFLSNIDSVVKAAKDAYNELDALQTLQIMNSEKTGKQMTENERMRAMLRTGRYIAPTDGRKATIEDGAKLTKEQLEKIAKNLTGGMKMLVRMQEEELNQSDRTIKAKVRALAKTLGTNATDFLKVTADDASLREYREGYKNYLQFEKENTSRGYTVSGSYVSGARNEKVNPYAQYANYDWVTRFKEEGDKFQEIVTLRDQNQQLKRSITQVQAQNYRQINRAEDFKPYGGSGGGKNNPASWSAIAMQDMGMIGLWSVADMDAAIKRQKVKVNTADNWNDRLSAAEQLQKMEAERKSMLPNLNPFADAYKHDFQKDIKAWEKEQKKSEKEEKKEDKKDAVLMDEVGKLVSGVDAVTGGLEKLGIELPNSVKEVTSGLQTVISIISGIATIVATIQTLQTAQTFKFWSTGGVVHAAGGYYVPGNYGYDAVPSLLTSGELVLNKAQQGVLATYLNKESSHDGGSAQPYVTGEQIYLGLSNWLRASGRGEIVTSR